MSRTLTISLILLASLSACSPYPRPIAGNTSSSGAEFSSVEQWLELQRDVADMNTEQIVARLVRVNRPEGVGQLYYYGLLNHHLNTYGAWTQARDTFRRVQEFEELTEAQRQLVILLEAFNQSRINDYLRQQELLKQNQAMRQEASAAAETNAELQQKLQALTELETDISTRKEQD